MMPLLDRSVDNGGVFCIIVLGAEVTKLGEDDVIDIDTASTSTLLNITEDSTTDKSGTIPDMWDGFTRKVMLGVLD